MDSNMEFPLIDQVYQILKRFDDNHDDNDDHQKSRNLVVDPKKLPIFLAPTLFEPYKKIAQREVIYDQ